MASVAVVGVGDMGSEMIPHLLAASFDVTAYDVNQGRLEAAVDHGARPSDSPAAAAREADVVLSLVMSADIESAHLGESGILAGLKPGAVLATFWRKNRRPSARARIAEHRGDCKSVRPR
jgi:3-hydroxyisobutyrate dehydrogenase